MADTVQKEAERPIVLDGTGRPVTIDPADWSHHIGARRVSPDYAQGVERQYHEDRRVEREYGKAGSFAMKAAGGGGLFTAGAIKLAEAIGDQDTADGIRRDFSAMDREYPISSGLGDAAGLVGLSALSGGFGGAAAGARVGGGGVARAIAARGAVGAADGAVGATGGLFSSLASTGVRWGAEAGAASLFNTIGQSAIQDVPLTWQQAASAYSGGFMLGGALGVGGSALWRVGKAAVGAGIGRAFSKEAAENLVLKEVGATRPEMARIGAQEGGTAGFVSKYRNMLFDEGQGAIATRPALRMDIAEKTIKTSQAEVKTILNDLSKHAGKYAPQGESLMAASDSIAAQYAGLPEHGAVQGALLQQGAGMQTKAGNWKLFHGAREASVDNLHRSLVNNGVDPVRASIVAEKWGAAIDSEMVSSIKNAATYVQKAEGLADKYAGHEGMRRVAVSVRDMSERQMYVPETASSALKPHDAGAMLASGVVGHPWAGAVYGIGKVLARGVESKIKNALSNKIVDYHFSSGLTKAAGDTRRRIDSGLAKFFGGTVARQTAAGVTKKLFEQENAKAAHVLSDSYGTRAGEVAEQMERMHPGMGAEAMASFQRAKGVLAKSMVGSREFDQLYDLRKKLISKSLDASEHKFLRVWKALQDPLSIIDDLASGKLTKDSVDAVREMAPQMMSDITIDVTNYISKMKLENKSLSVSKITQLGLLLNAPVSPMLRKEYIDEVQASHEMKQLGPGRPPKSESAEESTSDMHTESQNLEKT